MTISCTHRLVDLPRSWCFEHGLLAVALRRLARILRRSMIRRIAVLPSCPTTICDMRSVGCGVLDVGLGDGAVGRCVGGVDGRSVGSAAVKITTARATPAVKCAILKLKFEIRAGHRFDRAQCATELLRPIRGSRVVNLTTNSAATGFFSSRPSKAR